MRTTVLAGLMAGSVFAALLASGPALADVKAGVDAWQRGDFRAAVEQWRPLAIGGDADAEFNLAQAYKLGRGVPLDPALAESWYRKAALQGHVQAQDNYALALFQNNKKEEAVPWLEKSVGRDEPRAELVLGTMLFNGDGVPREYPRAYALMTRASQQGLQSASEQLVQMDQYLSPTDRQHGTELAQRYATQARSADVAPTGAGLRVTDLPPSQADQASVGVDQQPTQPGVPPRGPDDKKPSTRDARLARADAHARMGTRRDAAPIGDAPPPRDAAPAPAARHDKPPAPAPARQASSSGDHAITREAPPQRSIGKGWRIQLGAFGDSGNAQALWSRIGSRLGGASAAYVKAGRITRLQAGPFRTRAEAQHACAAAHVSCVVIAP